MADGTPFLAFASSAHKIVYPRYIKGGPICISDTTGDAPDAGSLVLTGGHLLPGETGQPPQMVQTGIISAMDESVESMIATAIEAMVRPMERVAILYPTGAWDAAWPAAARARGFEVTESKDYALAAGPGELLTHSGWMNDPFWGISAPLVATTGPPSEFEKVLQRALDAGDRVRDLRDQWTAALEVAPPDRTAPLADAHIFVSWGGTDECNLAVYFGGQFGKGVSRFVPELAARAEVATVDVFDAGELSSFMTEGSGIVDLPAFLRPTPMPTHWRKIV